MKNRASEEAISPILQKLVYCCSEVSTLGESFSQLLMNPVVINLLVKNGFFETPHALVGCGKEDGGINSFVKSVFESIDSLTEEQKTKIKELKIQYQEQIKELKEERIQLNKDIIEFFSNEEDIILFTEYQKKRDQNDKEIILPKVIQCLSTIEYLRKNFSEEVYIYNCLLFHYLF